jgi:hypothetical protein
MVTAMLDQDHTSQTLDALQRGVLPAGGGALRPDITYHPQPPAPNSRPVLTSDRAPGGGRGARPLIRPSGPGAVLPALTGPHVDQHRTRDGPRRSPWCKLRCLPERRRGRRVCRSLPWPGPGEQDPRNRCATSCSPAGPGAARFPGLRQLAVSLFGPDHRVQHNPHTAIRDTVRRWRGRFAAGRVPALADRKRSGRPPTPRPACRSRAGRARNRQPSWPRVESPTACRRPRRAARRRCGLGRE